MNSLFRLVSVLFLSILCHSELLGETERTQLIQTKSFQEFEVSLVLSSDNALIGRPFPIELRIKNVANTAKKLGYSSNTLQAIKIKIFDVRTGEEVPLTLAGRQSQGSLSDKYREAMLAPGETLALKVPMLQLFFDLTLAGRYRIEVSWLPQTAIPASDLETLRAIKANPPTPLTFSAEFRMNPGPL